MVGVPCCMVTMRHNLEHVVCVAVPDLEAIFGPTLLQTSNGPLNKVIFSPDALQLVLRVFVH